MEGECLSILRRAKEVSVEERHIKCQKSTQKKSSFMSFGVSRIKPLVSSKGLDWLFIKEKVGFALWSMLREFWSLRLTRLYVTFSTKTTRGKEVDE